MKGIKILEDILGKDTIEVEVDEVYHALALGKFLYNFLFWKVQKSYQKSIFHGFGYLQSGKKFGFYS